MMPITGYQPGVPLSTEGAMETSDQNTQQLSLPAPQLIPPPAPEAAQGPTTSGADGNGGTAATSTTRLAGR